MSDDEIKPARRFRVGIGGSVGLWFDPQPDITTFELAQCVTFLIRATAPRGDSSATAAFEALTDAVKRHFNDIKS